MFSVAAGRRTARRVSVDLGKEQAVMKKDRKMSGFLVLCLAPAVILFFIFMIVPTFNVFRISLYEKGAYTPDETFVGLANFKTLLTDASFIRSMQNMILLVVVVTIITFAFALVFAGILTREKLKGQNFFRVVFYIPNILSVVVISGIFSAIYKPENGMLNSIIGLFRDMTNPILWKGQSLVMVSIIIAMVWQAIGYYMVMYMASMASVPQSLYESAGLDGAGRLTQFFSDYNSIDLDKHPDHADLFYHIHDQHGVSVCEGHDLGRSKRGFGCGAELYVQPEGRGPLRLQHGYWSCDLSVFLRAVRSGK